MLAECRPDEARKRAAGLFPPGEIRALGLRVSMDSLILKFCRTCTGGLYHDQGRQGAALLRGDWVRGVQSKDFTEAAD